MRDSKICAQSIKTLTGSRFNCIILSVADGARGREFLLPKYYNNRLYLIIELTIRKQKKIRNKLGTRIFFFFYFLYPNRYQVGKKINEKISNHPCKKNNFPTFNTISATGGTLFLLRKILRHFELLVAPILWLLSWRAADDASTLHSQVKC